MPSFVIEYSAPLTTQLTEDALMDAVFAGAKKCGHFPPEAIKLRTQVRKAFRLHDKQENYLHVAAHILSGRTDEQKSEISNAVLTELKALPLNSVFVSVEIVDIHRASFVDFTF